MARDPNTPRSFGLIPRTPPGIQRAESPRLAAVEPQPPAPDARLVPVVLAFRLAAAAGAGVAVVTLAVGFAAGFDRNDWPIFVLIYVGLIGFFSRFTFSAGEADEILSLGPGITVESAAKTALRAAALPLTFVVLGAAFMLFDSDPFFLTFVIGMNGGYAISQWSVARRLALIESRQGIELVGLLPWRLVPTSLDGKLWSRPGTSAGATGPSATA